VSATYRSLHISDVHMSNSLPHAKQSDARGVTDRLADQLRLWDRVFEVAARARCEAIYVQGDLFDHSRVDAITLAETCVKISQSPVPVFFVPGNHDGVNTRGERFTVEALSQIERCHCMVTGEAYQPRDWLTFWPLEFSPLERTRAALAAIKPLAVISRVNVLLMHNSIVGCTHGGWTCEEGQGLEATELTDFFDYVLSGHFHDPQTFGRKKNGRYLGAPMHHRFDDVGRAAGFWVFEWRESGARKELFFSGGAPRFHTVRYADKDAREELAGSRCKVRPGDYVRVIVRCTHAKLVKRQVAAQRYVDELIGKGLRASWIHEPVYHHVSRLPTTSSAGAPAVLTPRQMVPGYVDAVEVDTTGLDRKALKRVGREIFTAVEGEWRG
jgi:DNA repair exonuclease SbcCD nuclease subunit